MKRISAWIGILAIVFAPVVQAQEGDLEITLEVFDDISEIDVSVPIDLASGEIRVNIDELTFVRLQLPSATSGLRVTTITRFPVSHALL